MSWEIELNIKAPAEKVFSVAANWHKFPELRKLALTPEYRVIQQDSTGEYFWVKVNDLPMITSYCYGRRFVRNPDLLIDIFTFRLLESRRLKKKEYLDKLMVEKWEDFFYQTTRLHTLNEKWTKLLAFELGHEKISAEQYRSLKLFYLQIKKIAEAQIIPLGINIIAEEVDINDEEAYYVPDDDFTVDGAIDAEEIADDEPAQAPIMDDYDPYAIMEIARTTPLEEVKTIYRNQVLRWHPDRLNGSNQASKEYGHNRFIEITAAYQSILRIKGSR
jgi:hypothetical protein